MSAARRARLAAGLGDAGADALLVTSAAGVRWLTGFTGSAGRVLLMADASAVLITDDRYTLRAQAEAPDIDLVIDRTWGWLPERLAAWRVADAPESRGETVLRLGVESDRIAWGTVVMLRELLGGAEDGAPADLLDVDGSPAVELIACSGIVDRHRMVKDDVEIAALTRACAMTADAFGLLLEWVRPGATELQIARFLEVSMHELGADGQAFPAIVASGPNGAIPHHSPQERSVTSGDLVTVDFGARADGYHADMTRTFAIGEPDPALRRIHEVVRAAQQAGVDAVAAGVDARHVDSVCRQIITDAGHGEHFRHGTGHGVGLEIHEEPFISSTGDAVLQAGMTITVEPGIYVPGLGGVRIEDVVHVTATGALPLTTAPRELLVV